MRQTVSCLSAPVRYHLGAIANHAQTPEVREAVGALAVYLSRRDTKHKYDRKRDNRTRVLIGARVSRTLADQVKEAAAAEGQSVYSWLTEAIREKLARGGGGTS